MSIRWNIRDRQSGEVRVIPHPTSKEERANLSAVVKNVSSIGVIRGGK